MDFKKVEVKDRLLKYERVILFMEYDHKYDQEIREELKRFVETSENEDTTIQNLWDTAKVVLSGKDITIQASVSKLEKTQIQKLTLHLKELERNSK